MKSRKRAIWTLTPSVAGALILVVDSMIALPAFGNITEDRAQRIPQVLASAPEQELTVRATEVLEGIGEQRALSERELISRTFLDASL